MIIICCNCKSNKLKQPYKSATKIYIPSCEKCFNTLSRGTVVHTIEKTEIQLKLKVRIER